MQWLDSFTRNSRWQIESRFLTHSWQDLTLLVDRSEQLAKKIAVATNERVEHITEKYLRELVLRRRLYNQLQEIKGNIRLVVHDRKPG